MLPMSRVLCDMRKGFEQGTDIRLLHINLGSGVAQHTGEVILCVAFLSGKAWNLHEINQCLYAAFLILTCKGDGVVG